MKRILAFSMILLIGGTAFASKTVVCSSPKDSNESFTTLRVSGIGTDRLSAEFLVTKDNGESRMTQLNSHLEKILGTARKVHIVENNESYIKIRKDDFVRAGRSYPFVTKANVLITFNLRKDGDGEKSQFGLGTKYEGFTNFDIEYCRLQRQ